MKSRQVETNLAKIEELSQIIPIQPLHPRYIRNTSWLYIFFKNSAATSGAVRCLPSTS
jgi:hypothetical protein